MSSKILSTIQIKSAATDAMNEIRVNRDESPQGLVTRYTKVNRSFPRIMRKGKIAVIAGLSGGGKSLFTNLILADFLSTHDIIFSEQTSKFIYPGDNILHKGTYNSPQYGSFNGELFDTGLIKLDDGRVLMYGANATYKETVIEIHIGFEMSPAEEILRTATNIMGRSMAHPFSSELDEDGKYELITDEIEAAYKEVVDVVSNKKQYYIKEIGTASALKNTVSELVNRNGTDGITYVISIDHALIMDKEDSADDGYLVEQVAKLAQYWKVSYNAIVIIVMQANNAIETRVKPAEHYPMKSDIYFVGKIWWCADYVYFLNIPKNYGIQYYGPLEIATNELVHLALLKGRAARLGHIYFQDKLDRTRLIEKPSSYFPTKKQGKM